MTNELFANLGKVDTIAAGYRHTLGLKSDGAVVSVGDNEYGQCDVSGWCGIKMPVEEAAISGRHLG